MREILLTKIINGDKLAQELGIEPDQLFVDGDKLCFKIDMDERKVKSTIAAHQLPVTIPLTIEDKLAKAGLSIAELRAALGL